MKHAPTEETITDGMRPVGSIRPADGKFSPVLADGTALPFCATLKAASSALHVADVEQSELDRFADDGGRHD